MPLKRITNSRFSRYLDVPTWETSLSTVCWSVSIYLRKWLVRSLSPFPPFLLDLSCYWQCARLVHEPSKWVSQQCRLTVDVIPFAAAHTVRIRRVAGTGIANVGSLISSLNLSNRYCRRAKSAVGLYAEMCIKTHSGCRDFRSAFSKAASQPSVFESAFW